MIFRFVVAFVALVCLCTAPQTLAKTPSPPPDIHPALFAVRDADSTLYLFGTVHVRPAGAPWGGPEARAALAASRDVWTEIEISPEADAQTRALALSLGFAPADHPLSGWLTRGQQRRLGVLEQRFGLPAPALDRMHPWLAALTLSEAPIQQAGFDPESGVDRAVSAEARAQGRRLHTFETGEQQLHFLAGLSADAQRQMLLDALDEADHGPAELQRLSRAWERGDLRTVERLVVTDTERRYPELYDVLFRRRNAAWVATLAHEMDGAGVEFIAVGAGHLVGGEGLVAQLRARGYRVERVAAAH